MSKSSGTKRSCVQLQDEDMEKLEGLTDEERRMETKRAYNRKIAARARQRTKDMVDGLSEQVAAHTARNAKLEKAKSELERKVTALEEENRVLRQCILDPNSVGPDLLDRLDQNNHLGSLAPGLDDRIDPSASHTRSSLAEELLRSQLAQRGGDAQAGLAGPGHLGWMLGPQLSSNFFGQQAVYPPTLANAAGLSAIGLLPGSHGAAVPVRHPMQELAAQPALAGGWPNADMLAQLLRSQQPQQAQQQQRPGSNQGGAKNRKQPS